MSSSILLQFYVLQYELDFSSLLRVNIVFVVVAVVQWISCVQLFVTPQTSSLSFTVSWSLFKLMFIELVKLSNHLILCCPFLLLPSIFSSISGSFPISWLFTSGGQSIGASASASVLPMNIRDWFLLELTALISLQSKGLSRVFSNTTVQNHQFFSAQFSLWSNSHIHI